MYYEAGCTANAARTRNAYGIRNAQHRRHGILARVCRSRKLQFFLLLVCLVAVLRFADIVMPVSGAVNALKFPFVLFTLEWVN